MLTPADVERDQLAAEAKAIAVYEAQKETLAAIGSREHADLVKRLVEPDVRAYFADVLPASMRGGEGFPVLGGPGTWENQIDLVIDFDGVQWSETREPSHLGEKPLYAAAIEVRYGGAWMEPSDVVSQVMELVERLQLIIDVNVAAERKCFTSAILLGPGFDVSRYKPDADVLGKILIRLAEFYRGRELTPRDLPGVPRSWPFVDAIALPSVLIKKHRLFPRRRYDRSTEHPAFFTQPVGAEDEAIRRVRPLAIAKGHLRHALASIAGEKQFDSPAWSEKDTPVYLGDYPDPETMARWARAVTLDGGGFPLFHAADDAGRIDWQDFAPDPIVGAPVLVFGKLRRLAAAVRERDREAQRGRQLAAR